MVKVLHTDERNIEINLSYESHTYGLYIFSVTFMNTNEKANMKRSRLLLERKYLHSRRLLLIDHIH